ncbi:hypothetical protein MMC16_004242 [Acarospora aff. strigata]|nr:hypothetical protein [Acarospora aff. strigata]
MRAVVFKGPHKIALEDRPVPKIQDQTDIIVKVIYSALCGSELHVFRGHQPSPTGFIMGKWHDIRGSNGCGLAYGFVRSRVHRDGGGGRVGCEEFQERGPGRFAVYRFLVRVPLADATVMKAPEGIEDNALVLMADIFPTGYFAAHNAFKDLSKEQIANATVVVVGCGPVGLCALINAESYKPKHLLAVDSVQPRLDLAKSLGGEPWNFQTDREGLDKRVKELTDGRGADVVIEVVGLSPALKMGFELIRPWGIISSVGVHNGEIPWSGNQAYGKNLRIQMGRCPVRSIFPQALDMLKEKQHLLGFMSDKIMPLSQAEEGYDLFDKMKVQKVVFEAQK